MTPSEIYPGTPIEFIPETIASFWRAMLILAGASLTGKIFFELILRRRSLSELPKERKIAWWCVFVFLVQNIAMHIERFGQPATYEGTLGSTIAYALGWWAMMSVGDADDGNAARRPRRT